MAERVGMRPAALRRLGVVGFVVAILLGFVCPAVPQQPSSQDDGFVGLPPSSSVTGTVRRMPDGSIEAVTPASTAPQAPAAAPVSPPPPAKKAVPAAPAKIAPVAPVRTAAVPAPASPAASRSAAAAPAPPVAPPPASRGPTIVSQIHNAPGWQPSHVYVYAAGPFTRVVNGPGWDAANGRYNPGRPLDAYQLVSSGSCTSASSGNGPTGTGAAIHDGACVWRYLSPVDYISITGWAFDNRPWKSGTAYHYLDFVTAESPLRAYALQNESCTSSVAPAGDASTAVVSADGCHWQYEADILYTSKRSYIPTETFTGLKSAATLGVTGNYEAQLWNDREYVAGQNGEASPIRTQDHDDFLHEAGIIEGCTESPCYHIIITTAPGESFKDKLKPSDPLAGYDPRKGVAIRNSSPYKFPLEPAGIDLHDNYSDLVGLQIESVHGAAVNAMSSYGNTILIRDCILDGGSNDAWTSHAAVTVDTSSVIANSLVISHGPLGVVFKYPGFLLHSTIVSPDHMADSVGVETFNRWVYWDTMVSDTAIFGFAHAVAHAETNTAWSTDSSHNLTDAPAGDAGQGPWPYVVKERSTVDTLPGTAYGASMANAFVDSHGDWRPKPNSRLIAAGVGIGAIEVGCQQAVKPSCAQLMTYDFDSPDIIGTARPDGRDDIGAWQSPTKR